MWFKTAFVSTIKAGGDMSPEDASGYIPSEDGWLVKPNKKMFTNPLEFADEVRAAEERQNHKEGEAPDAMAERQNDRPQASGRASANVADIDLWGENTDPAKSQESTDSSDSAEPETITDPNYDLWAEEERNK